MEEPTLQIRINDQIVFQSGGRWLHPLFELENHLAAHPLDFSLAEVRDKVIGKAAALLIARLGPASVHGEVMSELGRDVFERAAISHTYDKLVARIECQTEEILLAVDDPERAHEMLRARANRVKPDPPDC